MPNYVKQIATELNDVFSEITAQYGTEENPQPLFNETLSNFMDVGYKITSSEEWTTHFDEYVGKYIHRIGKTVFEDKDYVSDAPDIEVSGFEYGAILQKIRVGEIEFEENPAWNLQKGQSYPYFDYNPIEGDAKYFEHKATFMAEWSWAAKQLKSAFSSLSDLMKLRNAIVNKINIKKRMCTDALKWRLVNGVNATNLVRGRVVNLLEEYNNAFGLNLTAAKALTDKDFLRHASTILKKWRKFIERPTRAMNPDGVLNWTSSNNLRMCFIVDLETALETYLYSDTFHDDYVKFSGYKSVASWQGLDKDFDFDVRSALLAKTPDNDTPVNFSGVVAVFWDKEGTMVYNEEPEENSAPFNPKGKFYNYYYSYDCSYYLDLGEPSVTFIISDYSPLRLDAEPDDWESATNKYLTMGTTNIGEMVAINTKTVSYSEAKAKGIFVRI